MTNYYKDMIDNVKKTYEIPKGSLLEEFIVTFEYLLDYAAQTEIEDSQYIHCLMQGGRLNGKTYLSRLQQENQELKEAIEDYEIETHKQHEELLKKYACIKECKTTQKELKKTISELRNNYFNLYYDILCEKVSKLYPYYDIDKIKDYGVYVWNKADNLDDQDNIFDIMSDEIVFYTDDHTIIEEAKPIIKDIQNFIKKYYEKLFVGKESE